MACTAAASRPNWSHPSSAVFVADQDTVRIAQDTGRATRGRGTEDDRRLIVAKATSYRCYRYCIDHYALAPEGEFPAYCGSFSLSLRPF